jgi:hypothetical protein
LLAENNNLAAELSTFRGQPGLDMVAALSNATHGTILRSAPGNTARFCASNKKGEVSRLEHFYRQIDGWFDFEDIYRTQVAEAGREAHFVEVGTYLGKSAAFMAVEIANSGKHIRFDCVDTFLSDPCIGPWDKPKTLLETFLDNVQPVKQWLNPIVGKSTEVAEQYANYSLDFVFLDADHAYQSISADIKAWYPKVKWSGTLAGHDIHHWPGVKQAVTEQFRNFEINNQSWVITKPARWYRQLFRRRAAA